MMMEQRQISVRQLLQHSGRVLQFCCYIALMACSLQAWGLDSAANDASLWTPLIPIISPMYLEKSVNPLSLGQDTGWQLGGINSQFDSKSEDSSLSLRGGLFYSRRMGPRQILDASVPVPDNRFGQQFDGGDTSRAFGLSPGFLFGNAAGKQNTTDQITYQRMNYQTHGLSMSGYYTAVGKDFQGYGELVKQMAQGDADGAKLLTQGVTRTNYNLGYTGIRGLSLQNTMTKEEYEAAGDKNGLTKTVDNRSMSYDLSGRQRLEFSQSNTTEAWDPTVVKKDTRDVAVTNWRFTQQLGGNKSLLSFNQTNTQTTVGTTETDQKLQQYNLAWNGWQNFHFNGAYSTLFTEQTEEMNKTMSLDMATTLLKNFQLTGKWVDGEILKSGATAVQNDQLDLKLVAQLLPNVQFNSLYQDLDTPDKGQVSTRDQSLNWLISPRWNLTTHLLNTDNVKTGATDRMEYTLLGQIGNKACAQQLGLFLRSDDLPNDVQQTRREVNYTRTMGSKDAPVKLQVELGQYALVQPDAAKDDTLLTVQLLTMRPLPHTTLSLGYYDGPTLGAGYLAYRAWGQKPQGNLETWTVANFVPYREMGGEFIYALTGSTKLVLKQLSGDREDTGAVDTSEYGIEQQLGAVKMLAGQRTTAQTGGKPDVKENWWQVNLPGAKPLPEWAVNSTRQTVFADSATWGFTPLQAWVIAPVSGLTIEKRDEMASGKAADASTVRYATMLGRRLFLQSSYERDPRKADKPAEFDPLEREVIHLGYQVRPNVVSYMRLVQENRRDDQPSLLTQSFGTVGTLSKVEKLHIQIDLLKRTKGTESDYGAAYMVGYERTVNQDDTLVLKYRYLPKEFSTPETRIRLEASYQHPF